MGNQSPTCSPDASWIVYRVRPARCGDVACKRYWKIADSPRPGERIAGRTGAAFPLLRRIVLAGFFKGRDAEPVRAHGGQVANGRLLARIRSLLIRPREFVTAARGPGLWPAGLLGNHSPEMVELGVI